MGGALFWVGRDEWGIILGDWVGVGGALFWVVVDGWVGGECTV